MKEKKKKKKERIPVVKDFMILLPQIEITGFTVDWTHIESVRGIIRIAGKIE